MFSRKIIAGDQWREIEDLTVNDGLAEIDRTKRKIYFENPPEKVVLNFPPVKVKPIWRIKSYYSFLISNSGSGCDQINSFQHQRREPQCCDQWNMSTM